MNTAKTEIDNKNNALKASKQEKQTKVDNLNSDQKKIQKEIDDMEAELQKYMILVQEQMEMYIRGN